jgi:prepilin-type N-terminal cleavage/methylation domain-containing protein
MRIKGFTLIELLIVVAIIAILAAIAVPNFLEAQTRAKVARVKADIRTLATGLEAYSVDNNKYPIDGWNPDFAGTDGQAYWYVPGGPTYAGAVGGVTSPIAYLSTVGFLDPFRTQANTQLAYTNDTSDNQYFKLDDYKRFRYTEFRWTYTDGRTFYGQATIPVAYANYTNFFGAYRLFSSGPDRVAGPTQVVTGASGNVTIYIPYDPTNGTVSPGEITRTAKEPEQRMAVTY